MWSSRLPHLGSCASAARVTRSSGAAQCQTLRKSSLATSREPPASLPPRPFQLAFSGTGAAFSLFPASPAETLSDLQAQPCGHIDGHALTPGTPSGASEWSLNGGWWGESLVGQGAGPGRGWHAQQGGHTPSSHPLHPATSPPPGSPACRVQAQSQHLGPCSGDRGDGPAFTRCHFVPSTGQRFPQGSPAPRWEQCLVPAPGQRDQRVIGMHPAHTWHSVGAQQ